MLCCIDTHTVIAGRIGERLLAIFTTSMYVLITHSIFGLLMYPLGLSSPVTFASLVGTTPRSPLAS